MNKKEFLSNLRDALAGELPEIEIENNIIFYDDYISSKSYEKPEEIVINQLGDPRLIAKTIIETYQISHGPTYKYVRNDKTFHNNSSFRRTYDANFKNHVEEANNDNGFKNHGVLIPWFKKAIYFVIIIIILLIILIVGGFILKLFFSFGIPLLIIYFIYKTLKNRR